VPVATSTTVAPKTTVPKTTIAPVGVTTTAPVIPT
jgi:hypothetical protein